MAQAESHSITRRRLVAVSAAIVPAATVASIPALACGDAADPIYVAIAAHARAYRQVIALLAAQDAADRALQQATALTRARLAARLDELCDAEGPLGLVEMQATDRLLATVPQTLAGAAAVLRYVRELFERDTYPLCEEPGYRALLFSTECTIGRAAD
jgi:hypothetical protein